MMASLLLSRVLGLVRDMVIAAKFGSGKETDAYTLAFQIPDLIFYLIAGGALAAAFIPVFSEYLHTKREKEAWQIFSSVTTITAAAITSLVVLALIFAVPLVHVMAGGAEAEGIVPLVAMISRIVLPAQIAFFLGGGLMLGALYSMQRFAVPGLGPNIYNLGIIFGAVVLSLFFKEGVIGMAVGALIGAIIGNLVIPIWELRRSGGHFTPSFSVAHPGVKKVFKLMVPVIFGLSLGGVYPVILRSFASYYPHGPSHIYFSNLLMQAPVGIFGQSLAIAIFPALSQFFAEKRMDMYRMQIGSTLRTVIYLTIPVSAFMALAAPQIVAGLYVRGKFTPADAEVVTACLRWFCIGITAWCLQPIITRGFFAIQNSLTPTIIGTVVTAFFVGSVYWIKGTQMGLLALPLASSASAILLTLVLLGFLGPRIGGLDVRGILMTLVKSLLASALMVGITYGVLQTPIGHMTSTHRLLGLLIIFVMAIPGMFVYLWVTKLMKMPESAYLDRALARVGLGPKTKGEPNKDNPDSAPPYEPPGSGSIDPMEGA
jgi:putative peptidoglycan lipid II flippase